jgi:hypothetical protein
MIRVADVNAPVSPLFLEVTLQAKRLIPFVKQARVHRAVR